MNFKSDKDRDEKGRIIIYEAKDIPKNMTEKEEHKFWSNHSMSERLLEDSFIEDRDEDKK